MGDRSFFAGGGGGGGAVDFRGHWTASAPVVNDVLAWTVPEILGADSTAWQFRDEGTENEDRGFIVCQIPGVYSVAWWANISPASAMTFVEMLPNASLAGMSQFHLLRKELFFGASGVLNAYQDVWSVTWPFLADDRLGRFEIDATGTTGAVASDLYIVGA